MEVLKVVSALDEILREGVQQGWMRGLEIPAFGQVVGVHAGEVEAVERLDDARAHEFGPEPVDHRPGELRVSRQDAREFGAQRFVRSGLFATQYEGRRDPALALPGHPDRACGRPGIAIASRVLIVDQVFVLGVAQFHPAHDSGVAEECCLRPELLALALGEPNVDLFQMVRAVVARDALQVHAHEVLEDHHRHLVGGVFVHDLGAVVSEDCPADQVAGRSDVPIAASIGREQLANEFVVGLIQQQGVGHVVVEQVAPGPANTVLAGTPQIQMPVRPAVAPVHAADQGVHQLRALVWGAVGDERTSLGSGRDTAGHVEVKPTEKRCVVGGRGMRNSVALDLAEDVVVDEVHPLNRLGHP